MCEILFGRASFIEQLQAQNRIATTSDRQAAFHLRSLVPFIPALNVLLPRLLRLQSMSGIDEERGGISDFHARFPDTWLRSLLNGARDLILPAAARRRLARAFRWLLVLVDEYLRRRGTG